MTPLGLRDHKNPAVSSPNLTGRSSTPSAIERSKTKLDTFAPRVPTQAALDVVVRIVSEGKIEHTIVLDDLAIGERDRPVIAAGIGFSRDVARRMRKEINRVAAASGIDRVIMTGARLHLEQIVATAAGHRVGR